MNRYIKLFEAKQVGIIYHFIPVLNLLSIAPKFILYDMNERGYVSFTRNYKMQQDSPYFENRIARIAIDGNSLSEKYIITPFKDEQTKRIEGEYEERIKINEINIKDYIIQIDILKQGVVTSENKPKWTDTFEDEYDNILEYYEDNDLEYNEFELINQMGQFNFPINIINSWTPVK